MEKSAWRTTSWVALLGLYEAAAGKDARLTTVRSEQRNLRVATCAFSIDAALEEGRVQEMGEARYMRVAAATKCRARRTEPEISSAVC